MTGRAGWKRAVLTAGPTASGKSALALALAERLGGTIINADSMQIYRDLRIITARPTEVDETRAPHVLYGHVDAAENYSAGRWRAEAGAALAAAEKAGRLPILVGGTGLYFKSLTMGLAAIPPVPPEIRCAVRDGLHTKGIAALHAELVERDPVTAARLMPGDRARLTRALEVVIATGRSLTDWQGQGMQPMLAPDRTIKIFLDQDQAKLYSRIDARFDDMLASGALQEVRMLAQRGLDSALPVMKAHGVPWLIRYLEGRIDLARAAAEAKRDTRRYTRRQRTWFRHQLPDWTWVTPESASDTILSELGRGRTGR
jgi:tRNA dimethylallyltransferase